MAHLLPRPRRLVPLVAVLLAATTLTLPAPPAKAVTDEFGTATPTYLGLASLSSSVGQGFTVPAVGSAGPATPYPATMSFAPPATVVDVDLTIHNLTSTAPGDLNLLLVGPQGQQALVMSDLGGPWDVSNVSFTFSDEASSLLGDGPIVNGAGYQPQNQGGDGEVFPAPAPPLDGNTALSVFDGSVASGFWSLYIVDDQTDDIHTIGGWSLRLTLATRPYPSTVDVAGLPPVSDLDVKLTGLSSNNPDDIHLLLVGPHGEQAYLMGNAGGGTDLNDVTLTFDDEAASVLPDTGPIASGSYRPARYSSMPFFPSPAPPRSGNAALSAFDGLDPDGQWRLFGVNDELGNAVSIDGWSLSFTWEDTASPTGAVSVNGGAATTGSREVTVALTASDPEGTGVAAVRLSNDGLTFGPYQAYSPTVPWTLPAGDGEKRVYAQFKDVAGNESTIVSDSITLDTTVPSVPDTTGPRATWLSPRKGATGVKTTAMIKIKANEGLRKATMSKRTVFLREKGGTGKVPARVTYQRAKRTLVITPRSPLDRHATYVVTVKQVKDRAGNAWDQKPTRSGAQPLKSSFTTG